MCFYSLFAFSVQDVSFCASSVKEQTGLCITSVHRALEV
jgi:hypothetical protein